MGIFWWIVAISAIWAPTLCTGFRALKGSWKIMAISPPRSAWRRSSSAARTSSPFQRISPSSISRVGSRPMMARAVTDLPEPDSPTTANTSPRLMSKEMPSTGLTTPSGVSKWAFRPRIESRAASVVVGLVTFVT